MEGLEHRPFVAATAHHGLVEGEAAPLLPTTPSDIRSCATSEANLRKVSSSANQALNGLEMILVAVWRAAWATTCLC